MNYMGGKHRQGKRIAEVIRANLEPGQWYVEPFCGALGVASRVDHDRMLLADVSQPLIAMWEALQDPNLELPDVVTEEDYQRLKVAKDPTDWMTAYVGFGMSFGSKWFGGYARDQKRGRDFAANLKRSTNLKRGLTGQVEFRCVHYLDLEIPPGAVVYCDPPYANRTKAHHFDTFDHGVYWSWVRDLVVRGHLVFVTEFRCPPDFVVVHDFGDTVVRHHAGKPADGTSEVLAVHELQFGLVKGI